MQSESNSNKTNPLAPQHDLHGEDIDRPVAVRASEYPADTRTLEAWGRHAGASPRTLARLFPAGTEMTFRHWQRQARLLDGLMRLAGGEPVTSAGSWKSAMKTPAPSSPCSGARWVFPQAGISLQSYSLTWLSPNDKIEGCHFILPSGIICVGQMIGEPA